MKVTYPHEKKASFPPGFPFSIKKGDAYPLQIPVHPCSYLHYCLLLEMQTVCHA